MLCNAVALQQISDSLARCRNIRASAAGTPGELPLHDDQVVVLSVHREAAKTLGRFNAGIRGMMRTLSIAVFCLLFIAAGVNHFVSPDLYLKIMPPYLPWPLALVYVSGFLEVLGGIGVAVPRLRRMAGWGLIALLVAVFPANVHMVLNAEQFAPIPFWALAARLPLQGLLIAWVWWATLRPTRLPPTRHGMPTNRRRVCS